MVGPDDIRRKALNFYHEYLLAWLAGDAAYFPRHVPANLKPNTDDVEDTRTAVRRLRDGSKEVRGSGYALEWKEINSHAFGRNSFPVRVLFETEDDYLGFVGKKSEFAAFAHVANRLRAEAPSLESWARANVTRLADLAPDLDGLLSVVRFLRANPRPRLFARELPIAAGTKLVEGHQGVLRE